MYGVLFTLPLFRLGNEILGGGHLSVAKLFLGLTLFIIIINILLKKDLTLLLLMLQQKANLFLLLFLTLNLASLIFARHIGHETIAELLWRLKMFLLYIAIIGTIRNKKILKKSIAVFLLGSLLTTTAGLYEVSTGDSFFKASYRHGDFTKQKKGLQKTIYGGKGRIQGLYSDPGFHAHAMVIFIGIAIPWIIYARKKTFRFMAGALVTAYMINLIGSGARVGWVSMACALMAFLLLMQHKYKYILWGLFTVFIIIVFTSASLIPHLPTTERLHMKGDISWSWRVDTAKLGFAMIRDNPLLGVGTGNYLIEYFYYLEHVPNLSHVTRGLMHDSYLQVWVENGTMGLLCFLGFMAAAGQGLLQVYRNTTDRQLKIITLGLLTAFTGYAVQFSGVPIINEEMGWVLFSISVSLISINQKKERQLGLAHNLGPTSSSADQ